MNRNRERAMFAKRDMNMSTTGIKVRHIPHMGIEIDAGSAHDPFCRTCGKRLPESRVVTGTCGPVCNRKEQNKMLDQIHGSKGKTQRESLMRGAMASEKRLGSMTRNQLMREARFNPDHEIRTNAQVRHGLKRDISNRR